MVTVQKLLLTSIGNAWLMFLPPLFPVTGLSRNTAVVAPNHATPTNYGIGWECAKGCLEAKGKYACIQAPVRGYLTEKSFKLGWE